MHLVVWTFVTYASSSAIVPMSAEADARGGKLASSFISSSGNRDISEFEHLHTRLSETGVPPMSIWWLRSPRPTHLDERMGHARG